MKIDSVVVLCWAGDFRQARICLSSIRYFYPDIPLFLMKDVARGDFDTAELERCLNVSSGSLCGHYGLGWGKVELLFRPGLGRFLFVDADQIMVGPVLDDLATLSAQFVVVPDAIDAESPAFARLYYHRDNLRKFDPAYQLPAYHFNSGQFVATAGVLGPRDFEPVLAWGAPPRVRDPSTFTFYDQSVLNYVLHKAAAAGRITLQPHAFMHLARTEYFWKVPLGQVAARQAQPLLFHWAGEQKSFLSLMRRHDLLEFFEELYYRRLKHGGVVRFWRRCASAPVNASRLARQVAGRGRRKVRSWLGIRARPARTPPRPVAVR